MIFLCAILLDLFDVEHQTIGYTTLFAPLLHTLQTYSNLCIISTFSHHKIIIGFLNHRLLLIINFSETTMTLCRAARPSDALLRVSAGFKREFDVGISRLLLQPATATSFRPNINITH